MTPYFKLYGGGLVNIVEHTLEQIKLHPDLSLYIGCDSQTHKRSTDFATCIVYRYGTRGAHFVYYHEKVKKIKSIFERLYGEGERTIEAFTLLTSSLPVSVKQLEFDFAALESTESSPLVPIFKGWCLGLGQTAVFKFGEEVELLSTRAADKIVRKP